MFSYYTSVCPLEAHIFFVHIFQCCVSEPYQSHDWALVPAKPGLQGWILMNDEFQVHVCRYTLRDESLCIIGMYMRECVFI